MLCIEHGNYWLIYYVLFPVIVLYLMIDSSQVPSYIILWGSHYAHAHFSNMVLTMDAQKYIIKLYIYLDRMEDTDRTAC